ncbi:hypoxanthine phosphoribosyltransferase [bacterium DOLJORAL78_65_58]|nr:MAG: hypoxanthine phosphoribosyltransferase [bacterium DOLJORAL78_65_58]
MNKIYLDEETLILDSFRLGVQIYESGFRPTFIVGLWRGGSSVGIYVQECLQTLGVETNHISLRTSYRGQPYYHDMASSPETEIRVHGTQYLLENLNADDSLLLRATELKLDFRQHQTEDWLVFPYEIHGLTFQEIQEHKPYLAPLISRTPSGEG